MSKRMGWKNIQTRALPIIYIKGVQYFLDDKLMELREVNNPHSKFKLYKEAQNGYYNNFEVAGFFAGNALAYARGDLSDTHKVECLEANLETIENLLEDPTAINDEFDTGTYNCRVVYPSRER